MPWNLLAIGIQMSRPDFLLRGIEPQNQRSQFSNNPLSLYELIRLYELLIFLSILWIISFLPTFKKSGRISTPSSRCSVIRLMITTRAVYYDNDNSDNDIIRLKKKEDSRRRIVILN